MGEPLAFSGALCINSNAVWDWNPKTAFNSTHENTMNEATENVSHAHKEIKLTPADEKRFWAKVNKDGPTQPHMTTPGWVWPAGKFASGYGQFVVVVSIRSHRIAWSLANGAIPSDLLVLHKCDVPACCRPDHLFLGTHADNMRDKARKGRTPCGEKHGSRTHPERVARGGRNGRAKLTFDQVLEIRDICVSGGVSQRDLAAQYGVAKSIISAIKCYRVWNYNKSP